jgi:hypothetical protein
MFPGVGFQTFNEPRSLEGSHVMEVKKRINLPILPASRKIASNLSETFPKHGLDFAVIRVLTPGQAITMFESC